MNRSPVDSSDRPLDREEISAMVRDALRQRIGGGSPDEDAGPPVVDESAKDVITEADLRDVKAGARFLIREDAIITPAARDLIRERGAEIGSCMTANKVPGVRAAMCYDAATAGNSREHNYANVLTLGTRMISTEKMREIVGVWLSTPEGAARHGKRVAKLIAVEKQYMR